MSVSSKQRSQSGGPVSGGNVASRKQRHVSADSALASTTITNDFENEIITASLATPENTETNSKFYMLVGVLSPWGLGDIVV